MNKIVSRTIVSRTIMLGLLFTLGFEFQVFAAAIGSVSDNGVNVRADASDSALVIETTNEGTEVEIIGNSGDWYKVSYGKLDGAYISAKYIDIHQVTAEINDSGVNVRAAASTSSSIVGKVNKGDTITVIGQNDEWYQIRRTNGDIAYISKQFAEGILVSEIPAFNNVQAAVTNTYAIVTANTSLNLRETPSLTAEVITRLTSDSVIDVLEVGEEWIKVKTESGTEGYVSAEFISVRTGEKPSRSYSSTKGNQVIEYAKQFIGTPYSWGGNSLTSGVDCSGFVYLVMKNFGVTLNRSSSTMTSNGVYVERSELQAGDLVFFDTTNSTNKGYISHVGIYMGNGQLIHSSSGKQWGVTISSLSEPYYDTKYVTARRVLR